MYTTILHLEDDVTRMSNVTKLLELFPEARMFPAIDGREIRFIKMTDKIHHLSFDNICRLAVNNNQGDKELMLVSYRDQLYPYYPTTTPMRNLLGYNETGCMLSHLAIYKNFLESNFSMALIIEDDAECIDKEQFIELVKRLPSPDKFSICNFYTDIIFNEVPPAHVNFVNLKHITFNRTSTYIITRQGARAILDSTTILTLPIDNLIYQLTKQELLTTLCPVKKLWKVADLPSLLWNRQNCPENYEKISWNLTAPIHLLTAEIGSYTGLGNQMFQYAALRCLALKRGMQVFIKPSSNYMLFIFPYIHKYQKYTSNLAANSWREKNAAYDDSINSLALDKDWNIEGYLQNYKYFSSHEELIKEIFKFPAQLATQSRLLISPLREAGCTLVGVHIRMPDCNDDLATWMYHVPEIDFYLDTMQYYTQKYKTVRFLIFSNQLSRAKSLYNFKDYNTCWISDGIFNDMYILSLCDHFILSPSTFGWWAAFLCPNKDKEIIMAMPVFNERTHAEQNKLIDLMVPGWKVWKHSLDIDFSLVEEKCLAGTIPDLGEYLFGIIGTKSSYFVEIGAENGAGKHSTYLRENSKWTGMILDLNHENEQLNIKRQFVSAKNVQQLLGLYNVPEEFDLLAININFNTFYIWSAIKTYKPRVVIVAYNAHHPPTADKVVIHDPYFICDGTTYFGASILAFYKLAREKGYSLIHCTKDMNLIFVRDDVLPKNAKIVNVNNPVKLYEAIYSQQKNNIPQLSHDPRSRQYVTAEFLLSL